MAEETPTNPTVPPFLPLSEDKMVSRLLNRAIDQANEALQPVLFNRPVPYPWTVKSILIEVERDGRRYEVYFVGERWARTAREDRKPSREMIDNLRKTYDTLNAEGKKAADAMFEAIGGAPLPELLKESEDGLAEAGAGDEAHQDQGGEG